VPLAGFTDKVFYVWFDACIGYISITATYTPHWEQWWKNPSNVQLYQFMGKDNVPFHSVIFPGSLLGTGDPYTMLHHLSTAEFLNYENTKFSKSKGIGVFGDQAMSTGIPSEAWRYYLLVNRPESADSNFAWEDFANKVNNELRDNLGNFVNRSLKFVGQNFSGKIPQPTLLEEDGTFVRAIDDFIGKYIALMDRVKIKDSLRELMNISSLGNKYFQDNKPWQLLGDGDTSRCATVVFVSANLVKTLAALLEPFMPTLANKILAQLNSKPDQIKDTFEFLLPTGHAIGIPEPLISGIDAAKIIECKEKFGGKESNTGAFPAEIRIGRIVEVEGHPQADHLYVLRVDLGTELRTVVSGLQGAYNDRNILKGKIVLLLCNLKEAKFKGVTSQGMLLVADSDSGKQMEVLTVQGGEVPLGSLVLPEGFNYNNSKHKFLLVDFQKLDLQVIDGVAVLDGRIKLNVGGKFVIPDGSIRNARVK